MKCNIWCYAFGYEWLCLPLKYKQGDETRSPNVHDPNEGHPGDGSDGNDDDVYLVELRKQGQG